MIDDTAPVAHQKQARESALEALAEAGIGRAYADRSLDDAGDIGVALKKWIIENRQRIMSGAGFDFRGVGTASSDIVMLTARALLYLGQSIRVVPLVRLGNLLHKEDDIASLRAVRHVIIRDFETTHEHPLKPYQIALVEAFIEDRFCDGMSVSVLRRASPANTAGVAGWWSLTCEEFITKNNKLVQL